MAYGDIIRQIPIDKICKKSGESYYASIMEDTDEIKVLCLGYYDMEGNTFETKFNIEWLKDEKQVDWLASVLVRMIQDSFEQGKDFIRRKVSKQLTDLKEFIRYIGEK